MNTIAEENLRSVERRLSQLEAQGRDGDGEYRSLVYRKQRLLETLRRRRLHQENLRSPREGQA